jgi:hypothetical protein
MQHMCKTLLFICGKFTARARKETIQVVFEIIFRRPLSMYTFYGLITAYYKSTYLTDG